MVKFHMRTVKLKLRVVGDDPKAAWKRIRQINNDAWRAANWIVAGQYLNDQMMRRLYARKKLDPKDQQAVRQAEDEFAAVFGTKRQATTERDIKQAFPALPPCVTNTLNQVVVASYRKEKPDMLAGHRSLRTYRRGMPVPTSKASIGFALGEGTHHITWRVQRGERIELEPIYGRDAAGNRLTVDRIIQGDREYCAPQIQLNDKGLFLLLPVKEPREDRKLNKDLIVGVDLGIAVPAYVALSAGPARMPIGFREDFFKTRLQMQSRRRRIQRSVVSARSAHGRTRRLRALDRIGRKERDFRRSYNHMVSRRVVDFAIKYAAGAIHLEMLEGFGREDGHRFFLRNWSYADLQRLIKEKAARAGIAVRHVDPYLTSQTCSECGHFEPGQRPEQDTFLCAQCGAKLNADHNAALNIARSTRFVKRKEDCQVVKNRQGADNTDTRIAETAGPTAEG